MNTIKLSKEEVLAAVIELSDDIQIFMHNRVEEIIEKNHGKQASSKQMDDILDQVYYDLIPYCQIKNRNN